MHVAIKGREATERIAAVTAAKNCLCKYRSLTMSMWAAAVSAALCIIPMPVPGSRHRADDLTCPSAGVGCCSVGRSP